jgi:CRP-like cAMP-binding protein
MSLDSDIRALERTAVFGGFGKEPLRLLAFSAERRLLEVGDVLFNRGDAAEGGVVVVRGSLAVSASTDDPEIVVATGDLVGEVALLAQTARPSTAIAREPTEILLISRQNFLRMLEEFPDIAARLQALFARRLNDSRAALDEVRARLLGLDEDDA